jgi:mono/diheme cytochrome c family protein
MNEPSTVHKLLLGVVAMAAACTDVVPAPPPPPSEAVTGRGNYEDPTARSRAPSPGRPKRPYDGPVGRGGGGGESVRGIELGPVVSLERPPPPLGGASVLLLADGNSVAATDPDRDRVALVDLTTHEVRIVALLVDDEPGRLVQDAAGRVHVVLDRAGVVATIDPVTAQVVARRNVCAVPHGIALRGAELVVACSGGELVVLPSDPAGAPHVLARIDRDLRDVVVVGADLLVSRLRSAEVLHVRGGDGVVLARATRPFAGGIGEAFVGWRLVKQGSGSAALLHQVAIPIEEDDGTDSGYGGSAGPFVDGCLGPVASAITSFTPDANGLTVTRDFATPCDAVVPVDLVQSKDRWAIVAPGKSRTSWGRQVFTDEQAIYYSYDGLQAVAVTVTPTDRLIVLSREPAVLSISDPGIWSTATRIQLGGEAREDTGHSIFHVDTGASIACASCHPGGADDGHVWPFTKGNRRTQPLAGRLEGTAPYHWDGDMQSVEAFGMVFSGLMDGPWLAPAETNALGAYLRRLPAPHVSAPGDPAAVSRGKTLFESASVGCSGCHSGSLMTNNTTADVGTGASFQVPSLYDVAVRAPYLHDGRAATLRDSFAMPGHGDTSALGADEVRDLLTYVESL